MYWKYFKYVIKHKWFVFIECVRLGQMWRGITHDLSKFLPDEFIPYARHFYGYWPTYKEVSQITRNDNFTKEGIQRAFNLAWLKHIHRNPHHWQYWLLQEDDGDLKRLPMPKKYIKEMVADWKGAGRAITGINNPQECKNWYNKNKDKIRLNICTESYVSAILNNF